MNKISKVALVLVDLFVIISLFLVCHFYYSNGYYASCGIYLITDLCIVIFSLLSLKSPKLKKMVRNEETIMEENEVEQSK